MAIVQVVVVAKEERLRNELESHGITAFRGFLKYRDF